MKSVFLMLVFVVIAFTVSAHAAREVSCGGKCVETGEDKWFQADCSAGSESETSCGRFTSFGCKWVAFEKKTVRKSACLNLTKDRTLDQVCAKADMQNEKSCLAVTKCVWSPAAVTCLR